MKSSFKKWFPMCSVWRVEILHISLKIIENVLRIKSDKQNYVISQLSLLSHQPHLCRLFYSLVRNFHAKATLTLSVADEFLRDHLLSIAAHKRASTEHFLSIVPSCHLVYNWPITKLRSSPTLLWLWWRWLIMQNILVRI